MRRACAFIAYRGIMLGVLMARCYFIATTNIAAHYARQHLHYFAHRRLLRVCRSGIYRQHIYDNALIYFIIFIFNAAIIRRHRFARRLAWRWRQRAAARSALCAHRSRIAAITLAGRICLYYRVYASRHHFVRVTISSLS